MTNDAGTRTGTGVPIGGITNAKAWVDQDGTPTLSFYVRTSGAAARYVAINARNGGNVWDVLDALRGTLERCAGDCGERKRP